VFFRQIVLFAPPPPGKFCPPLEKSLRTPMLRVEEKNGNDALGVRYERLIKIDEICELGPISSTFLRTNFS